MISCRKMIDQRNHVKMLTQLAIGLGLTDPLLPLNLIDQTIFRLIQSIKEINQF